MTFREAVHLNNEGVTFLVAGEADKAVTSFLRSLNMIENVVLASNSGLVSAPFMSEANKTSLAFPCDKVFHTAVPLMLADQMENSNFVFQNAILLTPTSLPSDHQAIEYYANVYCACTIFNIALLHQHHGLAGSNTSLQNAEQMYRISIQLLLQGASAPSTLHATSILVLLAAQNNLSQIQFDRGAISEAKQGFESMYCLMQEAQEVFSEQEWDVLMTNVLLLDALLATAAAAA
jgi:hypothetical protein